MSQHMHGRDLYIRLTDPSGKHAPTVTHHRVWDAERFIASMQSQYGGPKVKDEDRRTVSVTTKEDYQGARK